jgi:alpha-tubulin suppressor-like RCC1 family protein
MHGRHFRFPVALLPVLAATLLASCDTGNPTGPRIVSLAYISGDDQAAPVGATVAAPLVVRAVDQNGVPIPGVPLTWEVQTGGGSFVAASAATDESGLGQAIFRLGNTLGAQRVSARAGTQPPVIFTLQATTAPASQLRVSSGNNQSGTVGTAIAALVVFVGDAVDNPKQGVPVTFTVASGGGSLSNTTVVSNAEGLASVVWTLGTGAGAQAVVATSPGLPAATFTATAVAAAPASMVIVSGNGQVASPGVTLPLPLRARVLDAFGNGVPGVAVTFATTAADGAISPPSSLTGADGIAQGTWTLGPAGGLKLATATAAGLSVQFNAGSTVNYAHISVGSHHTCAVSADNVLYCWGFNGDGQVGLGAAAAGSGPVYAVPQPSAVTGALTFREVSSGSFHTCALTLSFNPYCWGKNIDGRVGNGSPSERVNGPTHTAGPFTFDRISSGATHTCALTSGSRLFCWGSNLEGQIGVVGTLPIPVDSLVFSGPFPVAPAIPWNAMAAGGLHSCAVRSDGVPFCWGNNAFGQLGTGNAANSGLPAAVANGHTFVAITAGGSHSCALTQTGTAWCWGDNTYGQLGNGGGPGSDVPVAVGGGLTFESIEAGTHHTCGVAGSPPAPGASPVGGPVFCWGRNSAGQIGDGSQTRRVLPTAVAGGLAFRQVSAGDNASCGITLSNLAFCWGDNQYGQLGDGTQTRRLSPAKVAFQP